MKRAISNIILSIVSSELVLGGVPVTVRVSPRARRLRLKVDPRTRAVLLTVPRRISRRRALAWAAEHRAWVEESLADIPARIPLAPGGVIPFRGAPHRIDWDPARPRRIERTGGDLRLGGPRDGLDARLVRWLKGEALTVLREETGEFAGKAGVMPSRVGVGDPISRWGSCSSAGTIRYSWRLILAPDFVRRATVAHEVAHLVHMHHGADFHSLVERLFGADPKTARLWLRREGAGLHRIGGQ